MTDKQLFASVRDLGLSIRKQDGEYRVAYRADKVINPEASAYYTNDKDDALHTARVMAQHLIDTQWEV